MLSNNVQARKMAPVATEAPEIRTTGNVINVCCVEVTPGSIEKVRVLITPLTLGAALTTERLLQAGMKSIELAAPTFTTVEDIRDVLQREKCGQSEACQHDDATLTMFAISRTTNTLGQMAMGEEAEAEADPLVALPQELTLEELIASPQMLCTQADVGDNAAQTVVLFYARDAKLGRGCCCCCFGFIGAILGMFCCCCRSRRSRRRSPAYSRSSSNPLNQKDGGYYPDSGPQGYSSNTYYPNCNQGMPPQPVYAAVPVSSDNSNAPGAYNGGAYNGGAYYPAPAY